MLDMSIEPEVAKAIAVWNRMANNQRAAWVKMALKKTAKTQSDLAELLGLSEQTLSLWTNGKATIDWSRRVSIAYVLGLEMLWNPPAPLPPPKPDQKRVRSDEPPTKRKRRA